MIPNPYIPAPLYPILVTEMMCLKTIRAPIEKWTEPEFPLHFCKLPQNHMGEHHCRCSYEWSDSVYCPSIYVDSEYIKHRCESQSEHKSKHGCVCGNIWE